jgi:general secretion pathway protein F
MSQMKAHQSLPLGIRAQLFQQLAQMETAGLPFDRAFAVLDLPPKAKQRLTTMRRLMQRMEFAIAGERSGLFTPLEARLIHAAMLAGSPAQVYHRLADFYTTRAMQTARIKSRTLLPAAIFLLAVCLDPLPGLVTGTTGMFTYLGLVLRPLLIVGLIGMGLRWWFTGATSGDRLRVTPIVGNLILRQNVRDFFASLGLMLEAGIPMLEALPIALDTVSAPSVRNDLVQIAPRVINGATLAKAVADVDRLGSPMSRHRLLEFIATGEASGTLPDMLLRHTELETTSINDWYEQFAAWAPRILYGAVMLWMAISLVGRAVAPVPAL